MRPYLLEYAVEAHGSLRKRLLEVRTYHPDYQIWVSDLHTQPGTTKPLLKFRLIVDCADFDDARAKGRVLIKRYLDTLTFATSLKFEVFQLRYIIDWSEGQIEREILKFHTSPTEEYPKAIITPALLETVEALENTNLPRKLQQSLRWFANGVRATDPDAQLLSFWLSLELLVSHNKPTVKVNDLCQKCRAPLYCATCQEHPQHLPFNSQLIEELFKTYKAPELYKLASKFRNAIAHGDDTTELEEKFKVKSNDVSDRVGYLARLALINAIGTLPVKARSKRLAMLMISSFTHWNTHFSAHMTLGVQGTDDFNFKALDGITITLERKAK